MSKLTYKCTFCLNLCKPLFCSVCKSVHYCSVECQRKDWKEHKKICHSSMKSEVKQMKKNTKKWINSNELELAIAFSPKSYNTHFIPISENLFIFFYCKGIPFENCSPNILKCNKQICFIKNYEIEGDKLISKGYNFIECDSTSDDLKNVRVLARDMIPHIFEIIVANINSPIYIDKKKRISGIIAFDIFETIASEPVMSETIFYNFLKKA